MDRKMMFRQHLYCVIILSMNLNLSSSIIEENLIPKISNNVNVSMSMQWRNWNARRAIDHNDHDRPITCQCCSGTRDANAWWKLDLRNIYPIKEIIFIGRYDQLEQSKVKIYNNFVSMLQPGDLVYTNAEDVSHFTVPLDPPILLRFLGITNELKPLTICELKLIENDYCPSGLFGQHCEQACNCRDTRPCDKTYGTCRTPGCKPGWRGLSCNEPCWKGSFGQNCEHSCHCLHNEACHHINGSCPSGNCAFGWTGSNCSLVDNLIKRIHRDINATMSSQWGNMNASKAVDLDDRSKPNTCDCCSATSGGGDAWWKLDLGNTYPISSLIFIGRSDGYKEQSRVTIFKNFTSKLQPGGFMYNNSNGNNTFRIDFQTPVLLRNLGITNAGALTICELKLIESEYCPVGLFGVHCGRDCHCSDKKPCKRKDGVCHSPGCEPGWRGNSCNETCFEGSFGENCSFSCQCHNDVACHHIDGSCPNGICAAGWQGNNCSLECDEGTFGYNCSSPCHCLNDTPCNHINGSCPGDLCAPGWKSNNCSLECDYGTFGQNCMSPCRCLNDEKCNHINGSCPDNLCAPGWKGNNCSIECDEGTFGQNCTSPCHCHNDTACYHINGSCPYNLCSPGCKSDNCSIECDEGNFGYNCSSPCRCLDDTPCYHINGSCPGNLCAPGWKSDNCSIECKEGTFGQNCSSPCHCFNDRPCDHINGSCPNNLCAPGWKSDNCSIECDEGIFGYKCSSPCRCLDDTPCNHINGSCPGNLCAPGWKSDNCSLECEEGTFGQICSSPCHCLNDRPCDHINGSCPNNLCESGWKSDNCSIECDEGNFGQNCYSPCHCLNDIACDHINGSCPDNLCAPGWIGDNCSIACDKGNFGQNCTSPCHCLNDKTCDYIDGSCPGNLCAPGWKSKNCSIACDEEKFGKNCSSPCHCAEQGACYHINGNCTFGGCQEGWTGANCSIAAELLSRADDNSPPVAAIVGPVIAVVVVIILVAAIVLYRKRFSNGKKQKENKAVDFTGLGEKRDTTHVYSKPRDLQDRKPIEMNAQDNQQDHLYYSFTDNEVKIPLNELWNYIYSAYKKECKNLHEEFQKLPSGLILSCKEGRRPENATKTRYREMYAYDHSRVILKREDKTSTNYVNASYIDGYIQEKKFIASQGPMETMVGDFLEMAIQENTSLIVMLTNVIELGKRKCIQYWTTEGDSEVFGGVKVTTVRITTFPDYIIRELEISKEQGTPKRITQMHFTAWPDKDVPDGAWHLVNFWRKVNALTGKKKESVIVHCSAGIGRTGTFIALDNLFVQAKTEGYIQPLSVVRKLRQQRVNMVQTKEQYIFLHEAISEALHIGVKPIKINEFDYIYNHLMTPDAQTETTGLQKQFQFLQNTSNVERDQEYCNASALKESDEYRPKKTLSRQSTQGSADICHIKSYTGKVAFFVSESPDAESVKDMLLVVDKYNIKTIISLDDTDDPNEQATSESALQDGLVSSALRMNFTETVRQNQFIENTISLQDAASGNEKRNIKQFVFLAWREQAIIPVDPQSMLTFLNAVHCWQSKLSDSEPILVHCRSGSERSGIACVLMNEFERIRIKEETNILETVKCMKETNPQLIPNYAQFKFCYTAVLEYIRQSDIYMNL